MDNDRKITSTLVARRLLDIADDKGKGDEVTHLQLQKLVFFAHGWTLAFLHHPLVTEESVEAWQHGPVFRNLYDALRQRNFKMDSIVTEVPTSVAERLAGWRGKNHLSDNESKVISLVYGRYGDLDGQALVDLTHRKGTPWYETDEGGEISELLIYGYFREQNRLRLNNKDYV